ncbi:related to archipelago beta form (F-box-WD40 repeat protein), partial [Serendipita indica DSM 11827]
MSRNPAKAEIKFLQYSSNTRTRLSRKRGQEYDAASIGNITGNASEPSDIVSTANAAQIAMESIIETLRTIRDNQVQCTAITRRLEGYKSAIRNYMGSLGNSHLEEPGITEPFRGPLARYIKFLDDFHRMLVNLQHKRPRYALILRIRKVKVDTEELRKFSQDIEPLHKQFMDTLDLCIASLTRTLEHSHAPTKNASVNDPQEDAAAILQLPTIGFVASSVHNTCLKGTREAVLQTIWKWAEDDAEGKPIFWLCDIAGSGKSTVSMSVMESWRKKGTLGAHFFFSMTSNEGSTTDRFCSTIARKLVDYIPELAPRVAEAVKQNPSVLRSPLGEQFQTLVARPLRHLTQPVIIVIDGVDECKSGAQRRKLLEALAATARECSNLKIFITSRPDPVVQGALEPYSVKARLEDRLPNFDNRTNDDDIALYVHRSLNGVLTESQRQRIVNKANGLFIWASTACRMLTNKSDLARPESAYQRMISMERNGVIDDLYSLILEHVEPGVYADMYKMLSLLLVAFEPLTVHDVDDILRHAA